MNSWLPRASGDGPGMRWASSPVGQAPPRERGWTVPELFRLQRLAGSPARAGMDPGARTASCACRGLPRASGDGPCLIAVAVTSRLAPPRERGWTLDWVSRAHIPVGSPARAGMDPPKARAARSRIGLPRASGDGPTRPLMTFTCRPAPPRERGWTLAVQLAQAHRVGSPARAGMDLLTSIPFSTQYGLPRASGDGPTPSTGWWPVRRAPPRERGWTRGW